MSLTRPSATEGTLCQQPNLMLPMGLRVTPAKSCVTDRTQCHQACLVSLMGPSVTNQTSCHQQDSVSLTGLSITQGTPVVLGHVSGAIPVPLPSPWPINSRTAPSIPALLVSITARTQLLGWLQPFICSSHQQQQKSPLGPKSPFGPAQPCSSMGFRGSETPWAGGRSTHLWMCWWVTAH